VPAVTEVPGTIVTLKVPACMDCKHFRATALFELCMHTDATYKVAEKTDQHSVGHMRRMYACGPDAKLFDPRT
jgi:hypothetical protein